MGGGGGHGGYIPGSIDCKLDSETGDRPDDCSPNCMYSEWCRHYTGPEQPRTPKQETVAKELRRANEMVDRAFEHHH